MKAPTPPLYQEVARQFDLEIHGCPFHSSEGFEMWQQIGNTDAVLCIGFILGPQQTTLYRRTESRKDYYRRTKLWFFYGWLIRRYPHENQYKVLRELPSSEFNDQLFVTVVKNEISLKS
jgi:hypothetical protein